MAHVAVYGGTIMLILVHGNGFNLDRELRDDTPSEDIAWNPLSHRSDLRR